MQILNNIILPLLSLIVTAYIGWRSIAISRNALRQSEDILKRSRSDWRQQKWFDLYLQSSTAYDLLDRFQAVTRTMGGPSLGALQSALDDVTQQFRKVHSLASVFPKCSEIDQLFAATSGIKGEADARKPERLAQIMEASEALRQHALIDTEILHRE